MEQKELVAEIAALKNQYYGKEQELAQSLEGQWKVPEREGAVKTIAAYYHRMTNGGVQRVLSNLLKLWISQGYRVILLTDEEPSKQDYPVPQEVDRIVIPDCSKIKAGDYTPRGEKINQVLEQYKVERVFYHAHMGSMILWDLLLIEGKGIPCTICCHGVFSHLVLRGKFPLFFKMLSIYRLCSGLLVLSREDELFYASLGIKARYMPNPVEVAEKNIRSKEEGTKTVLWVGRIVKEKNPMDMVTIMKMVSDKVPNVRLKMVGEGSEKETGEVLEKIKKLGLEKQIELCGYQTDVEPYYLEADVFVSTSDSEGFPCTCIESKSYGVPAVYYELPYVELLKDRKGYLSVPHHDLTGAANAIVQILTDEKKRSRLAEEARLSIEQFAAFPYQEEWTKVIEGRVRYELANPVAASMMKTLVSHWEIGRKQEIDGIQGHWKRECEKKVQEVKNTNSFKLGNALLYLPGKIKRSIKEDRQ